MPQRKETTRTLVGEHKFTRTKTSGVVLGNLPHEMLDIRGDGQKPLTQSCVFVSFLHLLPLTVISLCARVCACAGCFLTVRSSSAVWPIPPIKHRWAMLACLFCFVCVDGDLCGCSLCRASQCTFDSVHCWSDEGLVLLYSCPGCTNERSCGC